MKNRRIGKIGGQTDPSFFVREYNNNRTGFGEAIPRWGES